MPKVTAATLAVTGLLLIALTGCSGEADNAGDESTAPVASASATPEESAAPLVAETPAETTQAGAETAYLEIARDNLRPTTVIPNASDEQLLTAGNQICEKIAAGEEVTDISVIEGETRNPDSGYYLDTFDLLSATAESGFCN